MTRWAATALIVLGTSVPTVARFVFDGNAPKETSATGMEITATRFAALPEATSSFGAAVSEGWLYVYGGHIAPTHVYSTEAVSGRFNRMNLSTGKWESLPSGPPVQGMNLASHDGKIYRVGGMQPRNAPGADENNYSLADVARFDPEVGRWEDLPPLPRPRSSHDVAVAGDRLFVIGGWEMQGKDSTPVWPDHMDLLDLSAETPRWSTLPQPFKRRAFTAAASGDTIYIIGGFDERSHVVRGMDIYDVDGGTWTKGPELPGGPMNGFGPAATVLDGQLYLSVDDGSLHRLRDDASGWDKVGHATSRIVHRLVPDADRVLVLGGAKGGSNLDLVEAVPVRP